MRILPRTGLVLLTEGEYQCVAIKDSLYLKVKVNKSLVAERLKPFEVSVIDTSFKLTTYGYSFYVKHIPTDSFFYWNIQMEIDCIRTISMSQFNPQPFSQKPLIKFISSMFKKEQDESEVEPLNEYAEE